MTDTMPISSITVPAARKRPLGDVTALAESISQNGLLNAITVTRDGTLISGLHRLEACKLLGWTEIPINVTDLEGLRAELAEIDENLVRSELTVLQQGDHLARRVEILESLGMRAPSHRAKKGDTVSPFTTTADIASELGLNERSAQRRLQIAKGIHPHVKRVIADTCLANSTSKLLDLARLDYPMQMLRATSMLDNADTERHQRILNGDRPSDTDEHLELLAEMIREVTLNAVVRKGHQMIALASYFGGIEVFLESVRENKRQHLEWQSEQPGRALPDHWYVVSDETLRGCMRYVEEGITNSHVAARLCAGLDGMDTEDGSNHTEEERALYDRLTAA